jgi:FdrA protein
MRIAAELRDRPGVREAAAFMGTPANQALLEQAGLLDAESRKARPDDLVLAVEAESEPAALAALAAARELLAARRRAAETATTFRPRTLESALRRLPDANLVAISVPGAYAGPEAMRALRRNRHVFLFSDNVPVEDEIALKQEALRRGLLCMGPDCGTAYLGGTGLGFFNVVPRGRVGCVAASGTGLQAVVSRVALGGEGISHGLGVGGRDLSAEVGGAMTGVALAALDADAHTEVVVLISKPPAPTTLRRLDAALARLGKPVVVCCLGAERAGGDGPGVWVRTLDEAADAALALLRGQSWAPRPFGDPAGVRARLARLRAGGAAGGAGVLGLYTGGTLAHEAPAPGSAPRRRGFARPRSRSRGLHRRSAPSDDGPPGAGRADRRGRRRPRGRRAAAGRGARPGRPSRPRRSGRRRAARGAGARRRRRPPAGRRRLGRRHRG